MSGNSGSQGAWSGFGEPTDEAEDGDTDARVSTPDNTMLPQHLVMGCRGRRVERRDMTGVSWVCA